MARRGIFVPSASPPAFKWLAALLALAAALLLVRLGDGRLWQDEAQTALVARTVLHGGLPRGFDGLNYFSQELGAEYGPGFLWRWHTWLPFYLLAAFFKVLGESTLAARLPFALAGLATVAATWQLGRRLWRSVRVWPLAPTSPRLALVIWAACT